MRCLAIFVLAILHHDANSFAPKPGGARARKWPLFSTPPEKINKQDTLVIETERNVEDDPVAIVRRYSEAAIQKRGQPEGLESLEKLRELCSQRHSFDFSSLPYQRRPNSVLAPQKQLLPLSVTTKFLAQVREMESHGWLSTNSDSVDGLPSLHLNLVANGKPCVSPDKLDTDDFERGIRNLLSTVQPYIYENLLPNVRALMKSDSIVVSEVFLRRYGEDVCDGASRNGISAHYDVFSKVTSVIAMDNVAADGTNGLYTTASSKNDSRGDNDSASGSTSNHSSLRRYFPLEQGDGVVHTWDVLHGVDIKPGTDRTSLIVWFTTKEALQSDQTTVSPWLAHIPDAETDDISQFVLGSAIESLPPKSGQGEAMFHEQTKPSTACERNHIECYLKSAAAGNAFALTRLGSLCEEETLSDTNVRDAVEILDTMGCSLSLPSKLCEEALQPDGSVFFMALARQFWLEGAVRGNQMAQCYLADTIMEMAVSVESSVDAEDLRLTAATFFGLAAQQGNKEAQEGLAQVIRFHAMETGIESEEELFESVVFKTAQAAVE